MKTLLIIIACGLLAACVAPSYRVVQAGGEGNYLVAQTPAETRYLRYDSGFYSPFHVYGIHPWWDYTYYSPNFYPHHFPLQYPSWPYYASGYDRWGGYMSRPWPPRRLPPTGVPSPPSGIVDPPGAGGVPGNPGIGSAARMRPGDQRIGGYGRYREITDRGVSATSRNAGPTVSPSKGASALRSPASPARSQSKAFSRPPPARARTGEPVSRSYRSVVDPAR